MKIIKINAPTKSIHGCGGKKGGCSWGGAAKLIKIVKVDLKRAA